LAALATPVRHCGGCGSANPDGARFCVLCGAALDGRPAPVGSYIPRTPALAAAGGATVVEHIYVGAPTPLPLVIRALWFFFVGLPLGLVWTIVAWAFNLTLIGLPLGLWMLALMPQVMTLRQERPRPLPTLPQSAASFAVRAVYFVLIGWWLSLVWLVIAWAFAATVIGLPLAFLMFERTGPILTLADS
jgi:uncharacterized membrane protein YccF (DUF307 family)